MPGTTITVPWGDSELQIALPAGWRVLGVFYLLRPADPEALRCGVLCTDHPIRDQPAPAFLGFQRRPGDRSAQGSGRRAGERLGIGPSSCRRDIPDPAGMRR